MKGRHEMTPRLHFWRAVTVCWLVTAAIQLLRGEEAAVYLVGAMVAIAGEEAAR